MKMYTLALTIHLKDTEFVEMCWEDGLTYQDYLTQCEYLHRNPLSKETFHRLCEAFDMA